MLEKNSYDQAKCPACGSWHFAVYLDDFYKPTGEVKCCSCGRFYNIEKGLIIDTPENLKKIENKNKNKLVENE